MKSEYAQYKEQRGYVGCNLGRAVQALAVGGGDMAKSRMFAEENFKGVPWMDDFLISKAAVAAATTSDATFAAPLALPTPLGAELVRLLYPIDLISQLLARGARRVPANILFPRTNVGASSAWVAAGKPVPVSKQSLDTISLGIFKTAGMVILTQELARSSLLDVASMVAQDMVQSLAAFRNKSAFDPDFAGTVGESPPSLTFGLNQITSSGKTIAALTADAGVAMNSLTLNGVPLANSVWIMSERLAGYISRLQTTTGALAFPTMSARGGSWFGIDVLTSGSEIESNSPTEAFFVLADVGSIAICQDDQPTLDIAKSAALQLLDNPATGATSLTSLWQMGLIGVRATVTANWVRRRDVALAIVRSINI